MWTGDDERSGGIESKLFELNRVNERNEDDLFFKKKNEKK